MKNINKLFAIAMLVVTIVTALAAFVVIMNQNSKIDDLKLEVAVLNQEIENLESDLDTQQEIRKYAERDRDIYKRSTTALDTQRSYVAEFLANEDPELLQELGNHLESLY